MRAATCPPAITQSGLDSVFAGLNAIVRASGDYWSGAVARRATPAELGLDLLRWRTAMTRRERPRWASPYREAARWPLARLLDFSDPATEFATEFATDPATDAATEVAAAGQEQVATLFLPPQAGHDSCIVDYAEQQSQIATAKRAGLRRVFSMDWRAATQATKNASIEDYLTILAESVQRLGGRVNLVGDCQGGWLAVIYAALHPQTVATLTIAGAPIDFHAGDPVIHDWMQLLAPRRDLAFYRRVVAANGGVLPGEFLLAGFIALQPAAEIDRQLQLLAHIGEAGHVGRYRTFETWFKHTQPVPGAFYLWIVEHLFQRNELIAGTLRVAGRLVDLGEITCPLYLLAGAGDHITPAPQVFALARFAGTDAGDIRQRLAPGGHLGLFMGRQALEEEWTPLLRSIARSQQPDPSPSPGLDGTGTSPTGVAAS